MRYLLSGIVLLFATNAFANTAQYFETIKHDPNALQAFIRQMPKGGELHDHFDGAVYAESLLDNAKHDNICINAHTLIPENNTQNCLPEYQIDHVAKHPTIYNAIIDAWSLRHFVPHNGISIQDHFFSTFPRFEPIFYRHLGANLADVLKQAEQEHEQYLELIFGTRWDEAGALAKKVGWDPDLATLRKKLLKNGINTIVENVSQDTAKMLAAKNTLLACQSKHPDPACQVTTRFIYFAFRHIHPEQVFAQLLTGFEVATHNPHFVGVNLVGPEDAKISLTDYHLHMKMIGFLHGLYPKVHITLHAGELTSGDVVPSALRFHITDAIKTAHAERIGHGADIAFETQAPQLLTHMATQHIPVEMCLSSNAALLGLKGDEHPLGFYLKHHVPIILDTDDAAILRTDLNREYVLAVQRYDLDYKALKHITRNALTYSFLPGKNLWADPAADTPVAACAGIPLGAEQPTAQCARFLKNSEKASLQWILESKLRTFEISKKG